MSYYTELFEKETGEKAWLQTYSERFKQDREYLNPNYYIWMRKYLDDLTKRDRLYCKGSILSCFHDVHEMFCEVISVDRGAALLKVKMISEWEKGVDDWEWYPISKEGEFTEVEELDIMIMDISHVYEDDPEYKRIQNYKKETIKKHKKEK